LSLHTRSYQTFRWGDGSAPQGQLSFLSSDGGAVPAGGK
jgi:hypothetical protein